MQHASGSQEESILAATTAPMHFQVSVKGVNMPYHNKTPLLTSMSIEILNKPPSDTTRRIRIPHALTHTKNVIQDSLVRFIPSHISLSYNTRSGSNMVWGVKTTALKETT